MDEGPTIIALPRDEERTIVDSESHPVLPESEGTLILSSSSTREVSASPVERSTRFGRLLSRDRSLKTHGLWFALLIVTTTGLELRRAHTRPAEQGRAIVTATNCLEGQPGAPATKVDGPLERAFEAPAAPAPSDSAPQERRIADLIAANHYREALRELRPLLSAFQQRPELVDLQHALSWTVRCGVEGGKVVGSCR